MAIKFSAKDQPAALPATPKSEKPAAEPDAPAEVATDLFKSPAEAPARKTRKKYGLCRRTPVARPSHPDWSA